MKLALGAPAAICGIECRQRAVELYIPKKQISQECVFPRVTLETDFRCFGIFGV